MFALLGLTFIVSATSPIDLIERATALEVQGSSSQIASERIIALTAMGRSLESAAFAAKVTTKFKGLNSKELKTLTALIVKKNTLNQVQNFLQQIAHEDEVIQEMALRQLVSALQRQDFPLESPDALALKALYQAEVNRTLTSIYNDSTQIKRLVLKSKSTPGTDPTKLRQLIEEIESAEQRAGFAKNND